MVSDKKIDLKLDLIYSIYLYNTNSQQSNLKVTGYNSFYAL